MPRFVHYIVSYSYSVHLHFSLCLYSIKLTLCVRLHHCCPSLSRHSYFLSLQSFPPYPWHLRAIISVLSVLSVSSCPQQYMILISFLTFESSQKVSTNPQTSVLSSCALQSFPGAVFAIYVAPGPTFRREFLCQNNVEKVLHPQSRAQIRRPIQTRH